jgi:hypothetical protein
MQSRTYAQQPIPTRLAGSNSCPRQFRSTAVSSGDDQHSSSLRLAILRGLSLVGFLLTLSVTFWLGLRWLSSILEQLSIFELMRCF